MRYKNMSSYNERGAVETMPLAINALNLQLKIQLSPEPRECLELLSVIRQKNC